MIKDLKQKIRKGSEAVYCSTRNFHHELPIKTVFKSKMNTPLSSRELLSPKIFVKNDDLTRKNLVAEK
jgi:hypothetical protein